MLVSNLASMNSADRAHFSQGNVLTWDDSDLGNTHHTQENPIFDGDALSTSHSESATV